MFDLSLQESHKFWSAFQDDTVYRAIVMLESVETGYHDGTPDFESAMKKLAQAIEGMQPGDVPNSQMLF